MKIKKLISSALCIIMTVFFVVPAVSAEVADGWHFADGWHKDSNSNYFYTVDNDALTGWNIIDGDTYYFNSYGIMQTGWLTVGSDYYYMDSDGAMVTNKTLKIDGKSYTFGADGKLSASKTTASTKSTKQSYSSSTTKSSSGTNYVLNTNTKKFHYPSCGSVSKMKDKNKKYYTGDRQDVINMGYDPCKNCNP